MIARRLGNKWETADPNTLLLLHGEDYADSSMYQRAVTNNGATIDNAGKFTKCIKTGGSKITTVECPPVNLGSSDFTIEFWIKATFTTAYQGILGNRGGTLSDYGWAIQNNGTKNMIFEWSTTGTSKTRGITSSVIPSNVTWEHWAVVRNGSTVTMYRNGVNVGSASISGAIYSTVQGLSVGYVRATATAGNAILAYIDELRISNIARWTGDFTPPTAPYTK